MSRRRRHPLWGSRSALALASLTAVAAVVHAWAPDERVALYGYGLPVLFAAATAGRRGGVYALVLVGGVMFGIATLLRPAPGVDALTRALPFVAWGAFGVLVACATGSLRDRLRRRTREVHDAHLAFRDALARLVIVSSGRSDERLARVAGLAVTIAYAMGEDTRGRDEIHATALLSPFAGSDTTLDTLSRAAGVTAGRRGGRHAPIMLGEDDGFFERVTTILSCLRERWDGTGRLGLSGNAIPAAARIIAVASAFDASAHADGVAGGIEGAMVRIRSGRGMQFDPTVVDLVLKIHASAPPEVVRRAS